MGRLHTSTLAAVVLALALPAAGCSRDPQAAYCETVEERQATLTEIAATQDGDALLQALPVYRDLAADAPRDIREDWDQVVDALDGLAEALDDAGVDPEEYDAADPPPGLDPEDRQAIERAAVELGSEPTVAAMGRVEQHALDVCGTPLSR